MWSNGGMQLPLLSMTEYKEYGVHYSELWHLLYWNPAHQLIVDPMQCILEGLVKHHIWNLLELAAENPNGADASTPVFHFHFKVVDPTITEQLSMPRKEVAQVSAIYTLLTA